MLASIAAAFVLGSATIRGGVLPGSTAARDCGGGNRSPELHWSGVPKTARSFAIVMNDPDAPVPGGFYHWALYDLNSRMRRLPAAFNNGGYYGPCPPAKQRHHYRITLYALDESWIESRGRLNAPALLARMRGHVVGQTTLEATYKRP